MLLPQGCWENTSDHNQSAQDYLPAQTGQGAISGFSSGEAKGLVWQQTFGRQQELCKHTLVCTMEGLCVRISWIRLKILKFTGTI